MCNARWLVAPLLAVLMEAAGAGQNAPRPTAIPARPVDERVADLLGRMTVEEKVAQLEGLWKRNAQLQQPDGRFNPATAAALLSAWHRRDRAAERNRRPADRRAVGPHARGSRRSSSTPLQKWLIENTRLGIPAMFHEEALHGLVAPGGTQFPVPIGLASTWDPALLERVMSVAAREARARGVQHVLVAGRRPRTRSALGPHRGDLRRGSVSRLAAGRGGGARLPGHGAAAREGQGLRHAEALRRPRLARRRHQHRAGADSRAAAAQRAARAVRGGGQGSRRLHA